MDKKKNPSHILISVSKHVLLIVAYYLVPYLFGAQEIIRLPDFSHPGQRMEFLGYTLMLIFLYVNFYVLVPRLFLKRQYLKYSILALACVAFIFVIPLFLRMDIDRPQTDFRPGIHAPNGRPGPPPFENQRMRMPPLSILLKHNLTFFGMCFLATMFWHSRRRSNQLEHEMKNAEMAHLRSQMNPHFMFNSLNSAYGLAISEGADKTSDSLLKLSDMMRYLLSQADKDRVKLKDELKYIEDYVNFQRLRLPKTVNLTCSIQRPEKEYEIAPMLLLPFIENAFKHGVSSENVCMIDVKIGVANNELSLNVVNDQVDTLPADRERSGLGFESTRKRLELIYPTRHRLEITDDSAHFRVQLFIQLA